MHALNVELVFCAPLEALRVCEVLLLLRGVAHGWLALRDVTVRPGTSGARVAPWRRVIVGVAAVVVIHGDPGPWVTINPVAPPVLQPANNTHSVDNACIMHRARGGTRGFDVGTHQAGFSADSGVHLAAVVAAIHGATALPHTTAARALGPLGEQ